MEVGIVSHTWSRSDWLHIFSGCESDDWPYIEWQNANSIAQFRVLIHCSSCQLMWATVEKRIHITIRIDDYGTWNSFILSMFRTGQVFRIDQKWYKKIMRAPNLTSSSCIMVWLRILHAFSDSSLGQLAFNWPYRRFMQYLLCPTQNSIALFFWQNYRQTAACLSIWDPLLPSSNSKKGVSSGLIPLSNAISVRAHC